MTRSCCSFLSSKRFRFGSVPVGCWHARNDENPRGNPRFTRVPRTDCGGKTTGDSFGGTGRSEGFQGGGLPTIAEESGMRLLRFHTFLDTPKASAGTGLESLFQPGDSHEGSDGAQSESGGSCLLSISNDRLRVRSHKGMTCQN